MTKSEIFQNISSMFIKGLMLHSQLMELFYYLGLWGYGKFHKKQYLEESKNYAKLCQYYATHYGEIVLDQRIEVQDLTPLYELSGIKKENFNLSKEKQLIAESFDCWVKWEQEVKWKLQNGYQDLIAAGEVAAARFIGKFVEEVDKELAKAEKEKFLLESTGFDMSFIGDRQESFKEKEEKGEEEGE